MTTSHSDTSSDIAISIRNLFKIFGDNPQSVLPQLHDGIDKADVQQKTGHVIGLNNINVDIQSGKITVIMGLSGSGKSTLIRHINRLIEPTAGEILLDGENILDLPEDKLRQLRQTRMSMVFQKFALLPHRTVLQNTMLAPIVRTEDLGKAEKEARYWLSRVELDGFEDAYPHQLSGGMQQRVGIARALTSNADFMLMDEAFSALDPLIRTSMQDLLLDLQEDLHKTIIFITHDLDEALKLADHLVVLKDGFVVQQGNPQHIILNPTDPYIEEFVSDINRARVLRVGSVMKPTKTKKKIAGTIDAKQSLEMLIAQADGAIDHVYGVTENNKTVGHIEMTQVYKALVRYNLTEKRRAK
ncbi:MAG: betaine/proline/choline family ABC transporter ATP-binding protein [Pseudomonadota bacterium]|nr:betaine/proline/choline family ABC transporter ATP-binding protein [Pseudomonadota bacterium]